MCGVESGTTATQDKEIGKLCVVHVYMKSILFFVQILYMYVL